MKMLEFRLKFRWSVFVRVQLTIIYNGLVSARRQAIIWTNVGIGYRHIHVSVGRNKSCCVCCWYSKENVACFKKSVLYKIMSLDPWGCACRAKWYTHINSIYFFQSKHLSQIQEWVVGVGKCPYDPKYNNTALMTSDGNFYSGTVMDFVARDPAIYRIMGPAPHLRSLQYNSKWLNGKKLMIFSFHEMIVQNYGSIKYFTVINWYRVSLTASLQVQPFSNQFCMFVESVVIFHIMTNS